MGALWRLVRENAGSPEFLAKNLVFFPKAVWLADWARRHGATHLHGGWATYPASVARTAAALAGLPYSFSGHAHDIYLDTTGLGGKLRGAAFASTCTRSNRAHLLGLAPGLAGERVVVVHHGLRRAAFARAGRAPGPLRILSVGTLFPHKGFGPLIEALALLRDEGRDFRATIVGGGPLEAELRGRVQAAGLAERVALTGALAQAQVVPHFVAADVFVLLAQPEWHWGIPNVVVEALAARNAVVTTRFGSVEELVRDGETGLLVPPRDPRAVAEALRRLAEDEPLRRRLAEAGHEIVAREFDLDHATEVYVQRFGGAA
jgi:glycosyltransferase involved in cell wall biosynthesis